MKRSTCWLRLKRHESGQSLVLIALMLLVLVAFIGLSVDVGNAYSRQRSDQAAASAAAFSAMNAYVRGIKVDTQLRDYILTSLQENSVPVTQLQPVGTYASNGYTAWAQYLDPTGAHLANVGAGTVPAGFKFIRVTVIEDVRTHFANLVGRPTLTVSADAYATTCSAVNGVYPLTFDHQALNGVGLGDNFTVTNEKFTGNVGHLDWDGGSGGTSELVAAWTGGGTLAQGFVENAEIQNKLHPGNTTPTISRGDAVPGKPAPQINNKLEVGDWLYVASGNREALNPVLSQHEAAGTEMILPLHSLDNNDYGKAPTYAGESYTYGVWGDDKPAGHSEVKEQAGGGDNSGFKVVKFARVRMISHDIHGTSATYSFQFLGIVEDLSTARACTVSGGTSDPPTAAPTNTLAVPTPTNTPVGVPTDTPVVPTNTPVGAPTNTPAVPTNTPGVPTNTPIPTTYRVNIQVRWLNNKGEQVNPPNNVSGYTVTGSASPGGASCSYINSSTLQCTYTGGDTTAMLVATGSSFTITHSNLPGGWTAVQGIGTFSCSSDCTHTVVNQK
ncbi:MAG: hypothetical protein KatS3mg057_2043 [Herpetosiphonaceae bacterium]|nr:MAG: hypothetical protein KatS3mg057_2043 [Herpetosiphonaceae bacterium]